MYQISEKKFGTNLGMWTDPWGSHDGPLFDLDRGGAGGNAAKARLTALFRHKKLSKSPNTYPTPLKLCISIHMDGIHAL